MSNSKAEALHLAWLAIGRCPFSDDQRERLADVFVEVWNALAVGEGTTLPPRV